MPKIKTLKFVKLTRFKKRASNILKYCRSYEKTKQDGLIIFSFLQMCSQIPSMKNFVIWVSRILNLKIAVVDYFNFLYFQWLVSLCRKMGLVYIRQVHVIGTILRMEVVQSDGKTKLCTVLCQFLDWPFKTTRYSQSHTTYLLCIAFID